MHVGETISIMSHLPKKKSYFRISGKVLTQQLSVSFWQWGWAGLSVEIVVFYARFLPPDKEQSTHSTLEPSQSASSPSVTSSPSYKQWPDPQRRSLGWDHVHLLITKNKNQNQIWTCWLLIIIRQTTTRDITEISWIITGRASRTLSGTQNPK